MFFSELGHKITDVINDHVWQFITSVFIVLAAGIKLWWSDRKDTKKRIKNNEISFEWLKHNTITKKELQDCRDDVKKEHDEDLDRIFSVIREESRINADRIIELLKNGP